MYLVNISFKIRIEMKLLTITPSKNKTKAVRQKTTELAESHKDKIN